MGEAAVSRRLIRIQTVINLTGMSRSTIWRKVKAKTLPQPVRLGDSSAAWLLDEIESWIDERVAERDARLDRRSEIQPASER